MDNIEDSGVLFKVFLSIILNFNPTCLFENVYFNNIGTHHLHYVATEVFGKGESHWPSLQTVKKKEHYYGLSEKKIATNSKIVISKLGPQFLSHIFPPFISYRGTMQFVDSVNELLLVKRCHC